jgi:YfiH family protein
MNKIVYKNKNHIFKEKQVGEVLYLSYPLLEKIGIVNHGFSTRIGGVSEGIFSSMNLSFSRGDDEACVRENFKRMAETIGVEPNSLVFAAQTHTTNVRKVTAEDKGKGIVYPLDYQDVDGLITNESGVCLTTFYADCVPLFFIDPVHKAIGLSHSGWRGTVGKMGQETLRRMKEEYGTDAKDVIAAVGPSICQDCYEVSEDVIEKFKEAFDEIYWGELFYQKENNKYQLNLWKANEIILLEAGVPKENIAVTNVCTNCNSDVLFSHRATKGERGSLAAFMALK